MFAIHRKSIWLILLLLTGCGKPTPPVAPDHPAERIISLAPNITEIVYALGLGDKLVGDTPYCLYPPAAHAVPKIGSFGNFNYEAIVSLRPDLVILHKEYDVEKERLAELGIPTLETGSYFIADILQTIQDIGNACGAQQQATQLIQSLKKRIEKIRASAPHAAPPRILLLFGSDPETLQAFGSACLHNQLLEIAGGKNVIEGQLPFTTLSKEAVIRLDPDLIIQLAPEAKVQQPITNTLTSCPIVLLTNDYTCIPGPRFIQTLEDIAEILRQNY